MKTIQKFFISAVLFFGLCTTLNAQAKKSGFDWDKVVYGGGVFPFISNTGTFFSANPFVGYKVTDRFVPGVLLSYQYSAFRQNGFTEVYNVFGVSPFARHTVFDRFFVQAEYEFLNGSAELKPVANSKVKFSEQNLFLGGGYFNPNGLFMQVMYNVTWKGIGGNSVYSNPFVLRFGYSIF